MIVSKNTEWMSAVTNLDDRAAEQCAGGTSRGRGAAVTLFEHPLLRGKSLNVGNSLRIPASPGGISDLRDFNFDNITSSFVVRSGTWVLYKQANYKGHGFIVTPGRYTSLPAYLEDNISSLKRVG